VNSTTYSAIQLPKKPSTKANVRKSPTTGNGDGDLRESDILYGAVDKIFFFDFVETEWGSPMTETAWKV
jgi:hypothetical protein